MSVSVGPALLLAALSLAAGPPAAPPADGLGDPLPHGALARLGSSRWCADGRGSGLLYTRDGKTLLVSGARPERRERVVSLLDIPSGRRLARLEADLGPAISHSLGLEPARWCISPDARLLASAERGADTSAVTVREIASGRVLFSLAGTRGGFAHLRFSPDGLLLAGIEGPYFRTVGIRVRELATGKEVARLTFGEGEGTFAPSLLAFSPDGKLVAAVGREGLEEGVIRIWEVGRTGRSWRPAGQRGVSAPLAFSPDGKTLAALSGGQLRLWDSATGKEGRQLGSFARRCSALYFSPDGNWLVAGEDDVARVWQLSTGREVVRLPAVSAAVFAPDSRSLAVVERPGTVELMELGSGKQLGRWVADIGPDGLETNFYAAEQGAGWPVAFSPDGKTLTAFSYIGPLHRWDIRTGKEVPAPGPSSQADALAFSPDGKVIATGSIDAVSLWDARTGGLLRRLERAGAGGESELRFGTASAVAFSADGARVAAGWWDGQVTLWERRTGKALPQPQGHGSSAGALAFTADGVQLVSGGGASVHWWDCARGEGSRTWRGPADREEHDRVVAFTPGVRAAVLTGPGGQGGAVGAGDEEDAPRGQGRPRRGVRLAGREAAAGAGAGRRDADRPGQR